MIYEAQIIRSDGSTAAFPLADSELILGRSSNVAISLPAENELELEHLLILARGEEGCWVSVAARTQTPVFLDGEELRSALLPWGTELRVGSLMLRLSCSERHGWHWFTPARSGICAFAILVFGFVGWSHSQPRAATKIDSGRARPHPLLFETASQCPSGGDARRSAAQYAYVAHSRADRYAYDPRDGIRAVVRFEQAANCYEAAGETAMAGEMRARALGLREAINADYATERLRLTNAVDQHAWSDALHATERLILLTQHLEEHDYVQWLNRLRRQVSAEDRHRSD